MGIITLTTDFGHQSGYPAAMKGVILSINPIVRIVDITHQISPQNIIQGAFIMYSTLQFFPKDKTKVIHIGVVDPGVGSDRSGIIVECDNGILVGPDNGLLIPVAHQLGMSSVYRINNYELCLKDISSTFHGRDIFAPIAAHISKGVDLENIGKKTNEFIELNLFDVTDTDSSINGKVLHIDDFGNIITNIPKDIIDKNFSLGDELVLKFRDGESKGYRDIIKLPFQKTYTDVPKGELLSLISSSDFFEVSGNQINANDKLKLKISDEIHIQK
jgi:S-adenosylmethionine hydrolase